jgi:proline iminopeptidase
MRVLDYLADAYELIYYDARGSGRSPFGDAPDFTVARAVADLEAIRAGLGIDRLSLLGHSLGGHLAYLYAAAHPDAVDALILVDVGPPLANEQAAELGRAMRAGRTAGDQARLAELHSSAALEQREPRTVEEFILRNYAPLFRDRSSLETVDFGFTEITATNVLDYEELMVESLAREDPVARLALIKSPTLVVHGELDPVPAAFGNMLANSIANARFALLPGASHFPFLEDRDQFEATVRPFLSAHSSDPGG